MFSCKIFLFIIIITKVYKYSNNSINFCNYYNKRIQLEFSRICLEGVWL